MKENYNIINYNNKKLVVNREQIQDIKEFITYEFIPNEITYGPNGAYIPYEAIRKLTKAKSPWFIGKIIKIIEDEGINILGNCNIKASYDLAKSYKLSPKKMSSMEMQEKIIEYKNIKNKIKEQIILSLIPRIRDRINYFQKIYTDKELLEDICYEYVLKAIDKYNYKKGVLFKTYVFKTIDLCITKNYLDKNPISRHIIITINNLLKEENITINELFDDQNLLEILKEKIIINIQKGRKDKNYKKEKLDKLITNKLNMFYTESLNDMEIYLDEDNDQEILRYNTQKLLEKRLKLLTPKQLEILKKYYYEGKKNIEIAKHNGVTEEAIRTSIKKSLKRIAGVPYNSK